MPDDIDLIGYPAASKVNPLGKNLNSSDTEDSQEEGRTPEIEAKRIEAAENEQTPPPVSDNLEVNDIEHEADANDISPLADGIELADAYEEAEVEATAEEAEITQNQEEAESEIQEEAEEEHARNEALADERERLGDRVENITNLILQMSTEDGQPIDRGAAFVAAGIAMDLDVASGKLNIVNSASRSAEIGEIGDLHPSSNVMSDDQRLRRDELNDFRGLS